VIVDVPDEPPVLAGRGWRVLLQLLVASAEEQFGPAWREHQQGEQRQGPGSVIPTPGGALHGHITNKESKP
jgi:hypothetical protein